MAESAVNLVMPGLPEFESRKENEQSGGTEQTVESQQRRLVGQQRDQLTSDQIAATDAIRQQQEAEAKIQAERKQAESELAQKLAEQRDAAMKASQVEIDKAKAQHATYQAKLDATPTPQLFADRDSSHKVMLGVGLALGAFGDAIKTAAMIRAGMNPGSANTVHDIISSDLDRQRENIKNLSDRVVTAKTGIADATQARAALLAQVDQRGATVYDRIAKMADARMASLGMAKPQIDQQQAILGFREKAQEHKEAAVAPLLDRVTGHWQKTIAETNRAPTAGGGGGGVEADKNAANFGLFKEHADAIQELMPKLTEEDIRAINRARAETAIGGAHPALAAGAAAVGVDAESGLTPRAKEYLDHVSRAEDGIGRLKSGGAINDEESRRFGGWLMPKPSDSPKDRTRLVKNIGTDVKILGEHLDRPARAPAPAAPAAPPVLGPAPPPPPAAAPPPPDMRARAVQFLRTHPNMPDRQKAIESYRITPEELR